MDQQYDVVIVGARVAGASLALLLGQRGHRVLLVDRDTFPSETMSTHFVGGQGIIAMGRLGILDDVVAVGFRKLTRTRTWVEDCMIEGPIGPGEAFAFAPRRDALDDILIRHAVERGHVEFRPGVTVEGLVEEGHRVCGVITRTREGERVPVASRLVVGADGKYSKVADWVGAERIHLTSGLRPVYYGHYFDVAPLDTPTLELYFVRNQIGFLFPMRPGEDCLALEVQPEEFETFRQNPQAVFEERYRALPGMEARMTHARLDGKLQGIRRVDNYLRKPYGPGWALTGDAAFLKDPCTGLGIGDALYHAFGLSSALDAALSGADWETAMGEFQRKRDASALATLHITLDAAQLPDVDASDMLQLRAAFADPHFARQALYTFAQTLGSGLPPHLDQAHGAMMRYFGARSA